MEAVRTLPMSITSSNRRIPRSTAWMAPSGVLPNCSMHWHRQAERGQAYFRLIKMKISVAPAQPDGNPEQFGKMLLGEHGGLRSVGNDAAFAQENYPLDLWNDFGYLMRHEQDPQPGLRKLAHGVAKLELRADVQSIARFVKQQGPRIVHQGSRNQRSLRSEEHTSELQSQSNLVCRLLLEKKKATQSHLDRRRCESHISATPARDGVRALRQTLRSPRITSPPAES